MLHPRRRIFNYSFSPCRMPRASRIFFIPRQTPPEILKIFILLPGPPRLRISGNTGKYMTVQFLHVRNPFRPDLATQPDDILLLLRIQSRKNGLKRIGLGQRELVIPFVNVSHVGSGIHHLAAFPDRLGGNFIGPIPEMNDSTCIQFAERRSPAAVIVHVGPQDFIPPPSSGAPSQPACRKSDS